MRSKAMQSLTDDLKELHPGVVIYGIGDDAHKKSSSDHNEDDTAGSKAAQSDSDSTPEHRAIDVMLGPAFNRDQAYQRIDQILATPEDLARLWYFNFDGLQWSMNSGWKPIDNSDDPHWDHIHFSGLASQDDNDRPWFGDDMSWDQPLTAGADAGGGTYPAQDWLIGANWKSWDSWKNTEILKAEQAEQTAMIQQLLTMVGDLIKAGGGSVDVAAILRGVDERLAAQREVIKEAAEAQRKRIEDAIADLGEGGAAKVRNEINSEQ